MRIGGTLTKWNDTRGYGFITPACGGADVFVHISEFPSNGTRPQIGEKLTFEVVTDERSKQRAIRLECPQPPLSAAASASRNQVRRRTKSSLFSWLLPLLLVVLAIHGYSGHRAGNSVPAIAAAPQISTQAAEAQTAAAGSVEIDDGDERGDGIQISRLPPEARATLRLIDAGGPFPFERDGIVFGNFVGLLPRQPRGYYHEYTVPTPGIKHRGARRIVSGAGNERYYTADHYRSFRRIVP